MLNDHDGSPCHLQYPGVDGLPAGTCPSRPRDVSIQPSIPGQAVRSYLIGCPAQRRPVPWSAASVVLSGGGMQEKEVRHAPPALPLGLAPKDRLKVVTRTRLVQSQQ